MLKKQTSVHRLILKKAWQIIRQNKFLWFFGFWAVLLGNGSIYEILTKGFLRVVKVKERALIIHNVWTQTILLWNDFSGQITQNPLILTLLSLILIACLALFILIIYFATVSRGALIASAAKISRRGKVNFQDGWTLGKNFFWKILGLNVLAKGLIFGFLLLIGIPASLILENTGSLGQNLLLYFVTFVIFTALALIVSMLAIYASAFIVIKNSKFFEAVKASWTLFIKNWLISLEMALILFLISLGVGIILIFATALIAAPFGLLLIGLHYLNLQFAFSLISITAFLFWFFLIILVGAILVAFQFTAWTLLFLELTKKRLLSKLLRFVGIK